MDIKIRNERPEDFRAVEELTREAFWNVFEPGSDEHYLTYLLRVSPEFVPELDMVAEVNGKLVGSIIYSRSRIIADDGTETETLTFGPLSVLPEYQSKGVGSALVKESMAKAREMGFCAVIIYGDPRYYCRFGFVAAEIWGIAGPDGSYAAAHLAAELHRGALKGVSGRFYEAEAFEVDEEAAERFDAGFPPKEKLEGTESQLEFLRMLGITHGGDTAARP